jgi:hypothetical protein
MKAFEAVDIPTGCGGGRHVFVSLGTAEKPAAINFLQHCLCGEESFGWDDVSFCDFPIWSAATSPEKKQAMAQHVITRAANR